MFHLLLLGAVAGALALPFAAFATEDARPRLQNSPTIAMPAAVQANPFSGTSAYAYRFELPRGTGGLTPELVLTYSTATRNTEYGYGWSLGLSAIERSTRFGAPTYLDPGTAIAFDPATGNEHRRHRFELDGELLVRDRVTTRRFHRMRADGSRIVFHAGGGPGGPPGGYWEVTDPHGTRYRYGSRPEAHSQLTRSPVGDASEVFHWALDEVIDARGNAYRIDYELDTRSIDGVPYALHLYPSEIRYSYHHGAAGLDASLANRRVVFTWQGRGSPGPDYDPASLADPTADLPTSHRPGFRRQRRMRLAELRVELSGGVRVRRYAFEYAPKIEHGFDANGAYDFHGDVFRPHSELRAIQRFGAQDGAFPTRTRFEYATADNDFRPPVVVPGSGGPIRVTHSMHSAGDTFVGDTLQDYDGDGFLDRSPRLLGGGGAYSYVGFGRRPTPFGTTWSDGWVSPWLFRDAFDWSQPPEGRDFGLAVDMVDLDGDGRTDRVEHRDCAGHPASYEYCWHRNNGAGFDPVAEWPGIDNPTSLGWTSRYVHVGDEEYDTTQGLLDVDGDGRPDHVVGGSVYRNNGAGFDPPVSWPGMSGSILRGTTRAYASQSHVDIDGDGLPDRHEWAVCLTGGGNFFNLGDRFQRIGGTGHEAFEGHCATPLHALAASPETGLFGGTHATLADVNGDGVPDLIAANEWAPWAPFDASGPHWNVYYGLGDGRYLRDPGWLRPERSAVDGVHGIQGAVGHHWSIPGFRAPEQLALGQGGTPPPSGISSSYFVRYTESSGPPGGQWNRSVSDFVDLTGDGLPDYVDEGDGAGWLLWENQSRPPLLTRVTSELGGATTIEYLPAPHATRIAVRASDLLQPDAPAPDDHSGTGVVERAIPGQWVVSRIEVSDGRGDPGDVDQAETFAYAEPRFDPELRELLGHRLVERRDLLGATTRTAFHQTRTLAGREQARERFDLLGRLLQSLDRVWTALPVESATDSGRTGSTVGGAHHAVPAWERVRTHDPEDASTAVALETSRTFDAATGTLTQVIRSGHGVTRTERLEYAESFRDWIVALPASVSTLLAAGGPASEGPRIELAYDGGSVGQEPTAGLVTERRTLHDGSHASGHYRVEHWEHDAHGNVTAWFDGNAVAAGATTPTLRTQWDERHRAFPERLENALGEVTTHRWDGRFGTMAYATDAAGALRCAGFDEFGRLERLERHGGAPTPAPGCDERIATFTWASVGDPERQHVLEARWYRDDRQALWNLHGFDGLGRVHRELEHAGGTHEQGDVDYFVRQYGWDARGRLACRTLPMRAALGAPLTDCWNHTARYVTLYDPLGRPLWKLHETDASTTTVERATWSVDDLDDDGHDDLVATVTATAEPERVLEIGFDGWNEVVASIDDPDGSAHRVALGRDALRRIVRVEESAQGAPVSSTEIAYHPSGERRRYRPPGAAAAWTFRWDDGGHLVEQTSRALETTRFRYDAAGRRILRDAAPHWSSPTCCLGAGDVLYTYDDGRLVLESTLELDHALDYTHAGEIGHESWTYHEGLDLTFSTSHLYDRLGRRTLSIAPGGLWPARHYDGALLHSIEHVGSALSTIVDDVAYHASGMPSGLTFPKFGTTSLHAHYGFEPTTHRLVSARVETGTGAILQDRAYGYDVAGNLTSLDDGVLDELVATHHYDASFRLTATAVSGAYSPWFDPTPLGAGRVYAYDAAGRPTNKGPLELVYGDDGNPAAGPHAVVAVRNEHGATIGRYEYDANGAVTSIERHDGASRWTLARRGDGRVSTACPDAACSPPEMEDVHYRYGADGRRVRRFRTGAFDRLSPAPWLDVDLGASTHTIHHFIGGHRVASIERSGLGHDGGPPGALRTARYYHPDLVGSNVLVTRAGGTVAEQPLLDAFGERLATPQGASEPVAYRFTDQPHDELVGLDHFGARDYDPWIGRFLSPDPALIGAAPGPVFDRLVHTPASADPYAYAENRPTVLRDRDGEIANFAAGAIGGAGLAIGVEIGRQLYDGATLQTLDVDALLEQALRGALFGAGGGLLGGLFRTGGVALGDTLTLAYANLLLGLQAQSALETLEVLRPADAHDDGVVITSFHLDPPVDDAPVVLPCPEDCRSLAPEPDAPMPDLQPIEALPEPGLEDVGGTGMASSG